MRSHPETIKRKSALRYLVPPTVLISLILGTVIGFYGVTGNSFSKIGFIPPVAYFAFIVFSTFLLARKAKEGTYFLPIVLPTMQLTWGLGFLVGKYLKK